MTPPGPPTRYLVCPTSARVAPELLRAAIAEVAHGNCHIHVVLPALMPATMPISGFPHPLAQRLGRLREVAEQAVREPMRRGRIEVIPCRSVQSAIGRALEHGMPDELVLVGAAPWRLRRALHRVAPFRVVSGGRAAAEASRRSPAHTRGQSPQTGTVPSQPV
jgi:hypothetical protein